MEDKNTKEIVPVTSKEKDEWLLIKDQARVALASGLLPKHIVRPEQAAIIALKGRELGLPIMQALASITVISGKPALSSELMLALIYKKVPGATVTFITPQDKQHCECVIEAVRPGVKQSFSFTIEDARRAGLLGNPTWQKYPQAMLRARCISAMARAMFPDAIMSCYTPEELGEEPAPDDLEVITVKAQAQAPIEITKGGHDPLSKLNERFVKPRSSHGAGTNREQDQSHKGED